MKTKGNVELLTKTMKINSPDTWSRGLVHADLWWKFQPVYGIGALAERIVA